MSGKKDDSRAVFQVLPLSLILFSLAAVFMVAVFGSNTGVSLTDAIVLGLFLLAWGLAWFAQMLGVRDLGNLGRLRNVNEVKVAFRILWEPVFGLAVLLLLWSDQPARVRLYLSSEVLDTFAQNVLRDGISVEDSNQPRQIGFFLVEKVRVSGGTVKLYTNPDGLAGASGLTYSPKSRPENIGEESFNRLMGAWYVWKQSL